MATIRIWDGCKVVCVVEVTHTGYSVVGSTGGAGSSSNPEIELDPFAGLIVDHSTPNSPVDFRQREV